jgi:carotenoid cleavage dioxygenase-like enzyme
MSWHKLFNETKKEFNSIKLKPVSGQIPKEIKGTFFQNSSVMTKRAGEQHITWFDGDGAILRIHLENGEAVGSYNYIQTKAFQEEEKSGKFLYPSLGRLAPGFLNRLKRPINSANRANTSVFPLKDKLLVLFDMGKPLHRRCGFCRWVGSGERGEGDPRHDRARVETESACRSLGFCR